MDDEFFMKLALEEARKAFLLGEVPVGAVVVHKGEMIASGYNQVEMKKDASFHAEMVALKQAAEVLGGWRLQECTLYCTLEPCCMCAGSMYLFRIASLVWGAPDLRHGANGSLVDLFTIDHPIHAVSIKGGVMQEECGQILKEFFQKRRGEKDV